MKSIPDKPGQITPFGGPEDPVRAWKDKTFFHVRNPGTYNGAPKLAAVYHIGAPFELLHRQFPTAFAAVCPLVALSGH